MKKIKFISLIMVILVFLSSISLVSCNNENASSTSEGYTSSDPSTSSSSSSESSSSSSSSSSSTSSFPINGPTMDGIPGTGFSSKKHIMRDWEGKTLNVLVTRYTNSPSAPWGQMELNPDSFGAGIGKAYDERRAVIEELYGIDVEWIPASANHYVSADIASAEKSGVEVYDIAMPRMHEAQMLASSVYNMHESDYIDFGYDYYNISAYEAYTVAGYTLFAAGADFSGEMSSKALIVNKRLLAEKASVDELYSDILNGEWTYDKLRSIASLIGPDEKTDTGVYGIGTNDTYGYFPHLGVFNIPTDPDTGMYCYGLIVDKERTEAVIELIREANASNWTHIYDWRKEITVDTAFVDGNLLFCNAYMQKLTEITPDFEVSAIPFPKLNAEQKDYIAPVNSYTSTLMCIPRVTQERGMAEYFVDVLSWTANDYTRVAYYDLVKSKLSPASAEIEMKIIQECIFDNLAYDAGAAAEDDSIREYKIAATYSTQQMSPVLGYIPVSPMELVQGWNAVWLAYDGDKQ